jgi:hypothetical protein
VLESGKLRPMTMIGFEMMSIALGFQTVYKGI